jgi:hypothetical protein
VRESRSSLSRRRTSSGSRHGLVWVAVVIAVGLWLGLSSPAFGAFQSAADEPYARAERQANPKLDSVLAALVERLASESPGSVAGRAPTFKAAAVAVSIRASNPQRLAAALRNGGATVGNVGADTVEAYVGPEQLEFVAGLSDADSVSAIIPPQPTVTSQGTGVHGSSNWNSFGLTGAGVKVGIIDVGFQGYSALIGLELPAPTAARCYTAVGVFTSNLADCQSVTPHGTAVTETVVDLAPNVSVYIANPISSLDLMNTVSWMAAQGVVVINQSLQWLWEGPGDGTTIYSASPLKAVELATTAGIVWVNSSGNANQTTWSGSWLDSDADQFLDYQIGQESNTVSLVAGQSLTVQLRWEDTWGLAVRDFDLLLYNSANTLVASSVAEQSGQVGQIPWEAFVYTAPTTGQYHIRVGRFAGTLPSWIQLQSFSGPNLSLQTPGRSITNPAESPQTAAVAVGAAHWTTTTIIEPFSSQGPTRDGRIKPDVVGVDCAETSTYGAGGFCGTSQASPHIAAVAALLRERYPTETAVQTANRIRSNAAPRGAPVPNNTWGSGLGQLPVVAAKLTFTQEPGTSVAGQPLAPQPRVEVQNAAGVTNAADNATQVTLAVSGSDSPVLSCIGGLAKTAAAGVAQFTGCTVTPAGVGYTILASPSCDCIRDTTAAFDIVPATNRLAFTTQPSHGVSNLVLSGQPVVTLQTAAGATITSDSTTQVTLTLQAAPALVTAPGPSAGAGSQAASTLGLLTALEASPTNAFSQVGPAELPGFSANSAATASFVVNYAGFSAEAQAAFQAAVDVWAHLITSPVPIVINATWQTSSPTNLGSAGPTSLYRDFTGAPHGNVWYPVALASALNGTDLAPAQHDINANFNSSRTDWYFGIDGNTPAGKYDLMSVVLHEIGHGLGFTGSMNYSAGTGSWGLGTGFPLQYDNEARTGNDQQLVLAFANPSTALGSALTSGDVFFAGPNAVAANGGVRPKLYAPASWVAGSSFAHLDELAFPAGDPDSLMTPQLSAAESVHVPGLTVLGILQDIGWTLASGGTGALTCDGGLTKTVTTGVAAFSGCTIVGTGTFVIHAAATSVSSADSSALVVTGPPDHLAFSAHPSGEGSGNLLGTQPIVTVRDDAGAIVLADQATLISLTLNAPSAGGPGVLSCTGGVAKVVVNGVVSFSGCSVSGAGVDYSIRASAASVTDVDSTLFSVFGAATTLAFSQQPAGGTPASPFPVQPVVVVRDNLGLTVTTDTSTITLTIVSGGGPGTLSCTPGVSKAALGGSATFAGCAISLTGDYQIRATATNRVPADTSVFSIAGVGPAVKVAFVQYPSNAISAKQFPTQPIVAIQDAGGQTVASDNSTQVTLSAAGVGGYSVICTQNTLTVVNGLASFSGCYLLGLGTYTLLSSASGLQQASTPPITNYSPQGSDWYFAEGFTGLGWVTELHLLNAQSEAARVVVTYLLDGAPPVTHTVLVQAESKLVVRANDPEQGPGPGAAFGVHIASAVPIVAEEQMYAGESGDFAHGTQGATALSQTWYFAEGFTQFGWETFVLVANPGASAANVTVTYQVQGGAAVVKNIGVAAGARHTFLGQADVPNQAFSVTVTSDQAIVAEMAMYDPGRAIAHRVIGVTNTSSVWFLGEGFTGFGWETFVSVGNPGPIEAEVTATFLIDGEAPLAKTITVPAQSRGTFIAHGTATGVGAGKAFGVRISSDRPLVVQEVLIDPAPGASRANSTMASATTNSRWSFSGGSSEAGMVTFITVGNHTPTLPATVTATYYFNDGTPPASQVLVIPGSSRGTFVSSDGIPPNKLFGTVITSTLAVVAQEAVYDEPRSRAFSAAGMAGP